MKLCTSVILAASSLPSVFAWGTVGHEAVAYIASNFVTSATKAFCQGILGDTSADYLANVATWADSYRSTSEGAFSKPFHFIDANDTPPSSCSVDYTRDCGAAGCVVAAISNYTSILQSSDDVSALKFLIHFIGDIHQPLHDEALELGGNHISVTYNGASSNLHHVWDTEMITSLSGGTTLATAKSLATTLTTAIKTGTYKSVKSSWLSGISISDPVTSSMSWASESNAYVCSNVLKPGISTVEDTDLSGSYYTAAKPIIQIQLARAGYRLAAWLNLIATGSTGLCVVLILLRLLEGGGLLGGLDVVIVFGLWVTFVIKFLH